MKKEREREEEGGRKGERGRQKKVCWGERKRGGREKELESEGGRQRGREGESEGGRWREGWAEWGREKE